MRGSDMSHPRDDLANYFVAACGLRSGSPEVRRPAIAALAQLAGRSVAPIRARAEGALTAEFGPYVMSDGLPPCLAPFPVVETCESQCGSCVWRWQNQHVPSGFGPRPVARAE